MVLKQGALRTKFRDLRKKSQRQWKGQEIRVREVKEFEENRAKEVCTALAKMEFREGVGSPQCQTPQ